MKHWRIVPLRVGKGLWWVIFFRGKRSHRAMELGMAMNYIAQHYKPH